MLDHVVSEVMASDSDDDDAIIELTRLTEPRYDHPQCSIQEKTKASNKIGFSTRKIKSQNLHMG